MKNIRFILIMAMTILIGFAAQNRAQDNDDLQSQIQKFQAGTHQFLLAGLAQTSLIQKPNESQIETAFEPIFLYKATNKLLFEAEIEAEIEDGGQAINLEYAQLQYILSDYFTFGAGRYLNPANFFIERLHPAWISKMPDKPFFVHEDTKMMANSHIGFQLRGAAPIKGSKIEYAFFVGMGAKLDPATGWVDFTNFGDNNKNKSFGGRIGFIPVPEVEIGYGFEVAKTGDMDTPYEDIKAVNHSVDFNFVKDVKGLKGGLDVRAQFVWLNIDNPNMGTLTFDNSTFGGYGQIAYRPYNSSSEFFQNLELAYRYDWSNKPDNAPSNEYLKRSTIAFNYWVSSSSLFKIAYETTDTELPNGATSNSHRWVGQFAIGF